MEKTNYLEYLFDSIKDKVEFDTDVLALEKLLLAMLKIDLKLSINKWIEILDGYDIKTMSVDIDFEAILSSYPKEVIMVSGLEYFLEVTNSITEKKRNLVYMSIFNIYRDDNVLYKLISECINNKNIKEEKELIYLIIKNAGDSLRSVFDIVKFLKDVIIMHIENDLIDMDLLNELADIPDNLKDKAILKTLLIDYI